MPWMEVVSGAAMDRWDGLGQGESVAPVSLAVKWPSDAASDATGPTEAIVAAIGEAWQREYSRLLVIARSIAPHMREDIVSECYLLAVSEWKFKSSADCGRYLAKCARGLAINAVVRRKTRAIDPRLPEYRESMLPEWIETSGQHDSLVRDIYVTADVAERKIIRCVLSDNAPGVHLGNVTYWTAIGNMAGLSYTNVMLHLRNLRARYRSTGKPIATRSGASKRGRFAVVRSHTLWHLLTALESDTAICTDRAELGFCLWLAGLLARAKVC